MNTTGTEKYNSHTRKIVNFRIHDATIKDLQKQVSQMHKKIATVDSSKKSTNSKRIGTKTDSRRKVSSKKASSNKKSKKSTNIRQNSKRR